MKPYKSKIIDVHQHLNFWGRSNKALVRHQEKMGVDLTVVLPSDGKDDLLAYVSGPEEAYKLTSKRKDFLFASNAHRDDPKLQLNLAKYLDRGAVLIGELKFEATGDSSYLHPYIEVAQQYDVPILLHFQEKKGFELSGFEHILAQYPDVNFIGHATEFWGKMETTTDELLTRYPNFYGDTSASSGWAALHRDYARRFLIKHQDKLLFGSDCQDPKTPTEAYKKRYGERCLGHESMHQIISLVSNDVHKKIFYKNAQRLLKLEDLEKKVHTDGINKILYRNARKLLGYLGGNDG
jgi:predicted TIM-barrel fold metal-dependent hydrolase